MPQPKKKTSKSKKNSRRQHWNAKSQENLVKCKNTGEWVPHRLYRYYNDVNIAKDA